MDNISKSERDDGCAKSLGGGLGFFGIIILLALWSALAEYIITGLVVLVLAVSLVVKVFGKQ